MDAFKGKWKDQNNDIISIEESNNMAILKYSNGRGPFSGYGLDLGSPVISVNFSDDSNPKESLQAGLMDFSKNTITWSNTTVWRKNK